MGRGGCGVAAWPGGGCSAAARPPEQARRGEASSRRDAAPAVLRTPGRPRGVAMSGAMKFNGYLKVRIGEAVGLQPTRWSLRHSLFRKGYQLLDPYVTVSVDQVRVGQTSTKQKTNKPTYNEEFSATVTDGHQIELSVFHDTPIGYDDFVANCTLHFQDLLRSAGPGDSFEGWVSSWAPANEWRQSGACPCTPVLRMHAACCACRCAVVHLLVLVPDRRG